MVFWQCPVSSKLRLLLHVSPLASEHRVCMSCGFRGWFLRRVGLSGAPNTGMSSWWLFASEQAVHNFSFKKENKQRLVSKCKHIFLLRHWILSGSVWDSCESQGNDCLPWGHRKRWVPVHGQLVEGGGARLYYLVWSSRFKVCLWVICHFFCKYSCYTRTQTPPHPSLLQTSQEPSPFWLGHQWPQLFQPVTSTSLSSFVRNAHNQTPPRPVHSQTLGMGPEICV